LRITDRPRIAYNVILGCAFGAIIGLFARYLGSGSDIGPAVVALLAGFNVPAVFFFLGELSNRVFGMNETASVPK
jgi:Na+/H+-dicarboxylate symporter